MAALASPSPTTALTPLPSLAQRVRTIETIISTVVLTMVSDARVLDLCLKYGDEKVAASLARVAEVALDRASSTGALDDGLEIVPPPAEMTRVSEELVLLDPDSPRNSFSGEAGTVLLAQHAQRYGPAAHGHALGTDAAASAPPPALSSTGAEQASPPKGISPRRSRLPACSPGASFQGESSGRTPSSISIPEVAPPPAAPAPEVDCPSFSADELEALKASCASGFAEHGPAHELALAYMRWRRDDALAASGGEPLSAEFASDIRLLRFLTACSWDPGAAADMYVEALTWRAEQRMDEVRDQLVRDNAAFFAQGGGAACPNSRP